MPPASRASGQSRRHRGLGRCPGIRTERPSVATRPARLRASVVVPDFGAVPRTTMKGASRRIIGKRGGKRSGSSACARYGAGAHDADRETVTSATITATVVNNNSGRLAAPTACQASVAPRPKAVKPTATDTASTSAASGVTSAGRRARSADTLLAIGEPRRLGRGERGVAQHEKPDRYLGGYRYRGSADVDLPWAKAR